MTRGKAVQFQLTILVEAAVSRSKRLSACLGRWRTGGRIPPVGEITENTDEDSRSNWRP